MKLSSLVLLLVTLLVLGGLWYWVDRQEQKEPDGLPPKVSPLLSALPGSPEEIWTFGAEGLREFRFQVGPPPMLSYPSEDQANPAYVQGLHDSLVTAQKQFVCLAEEITPKMLEERGLDEPLGRIHVRSQGKTVEIILGGEDVFRGQMPQSFALVNGDLYKVPSGLDSHLHANLHDLRNPLLFRTEPAGVRSLTLDRRSSQGDVQRVKIQRKPNGEYHIVEPIEAPADTARLAAVLSGLLGARARRFLPIAGTPQQVLTEDPWLEIAIQGNLGDEHATIWQDPQQAFYARVRGRDVILVLDLDSLHRVVLSSAKELVDRTLWPFPVTETARLQLQRRGGEAPLALLSLHPEPGFRIIQPREGWSDSVQVVRLFDALKRIEVQKILVDEELESARKILAVPEYVLQLSLPPGRRGDPLEFALAREGEQWFGQRSGASYALQLGDVAAEVLSQPWTAYVEKVAFRIDRARRPNRVVVREGDDEWVFERGDDGIWRKGDEPARDFQERTWDRLLELKAERVVPDLAPDSLGDPLRSYEVQHVRAPGAEPRTLGLLRLFRGPGAQLRSHRSGQQLVFEIWDGYTKDLLLR